MSDTTILPSLVLQSLPYAVLLLDRTGTIRFANALAGQFLNCAEATLYGRPIQDVIEDGMVLLTKPPTHHWLNGRLVISRATPLPAHQSVLDEGGTLVTFSDCTEEYHMLGIAAEYMSMAASELRVPLTPMHGFLELLLNGAVGPITIEQREFIETIQHNTLRMRDLVDDLLEVGRVRAGKMILRLGNGNLRALIERVQQEAQDRFLARSIELHVDYAVPSEHINADMKRLEKVLTELLDNARRYTLPGGQVTLRIAPTKDGTRFDVQDTGIGIKDSDKHHIFHPFFRGDTGSLRDEEGGCGLSLFIIQGFVELHGGTIWFESRQGEGSTFSFFLPTHPTPLEKNL